MKKRLLIWALAAATAFNAALAGPLELNKFLITNEKSGVRDEYGKSYWGGRNFKSEKGYEVKVSGNSYVHYTSGEQKRLLNFEVRDKNTGIFIFDNDADGLGDDDLLTIHHNFRNGDKLFVSLRYKPHGEYEITSSLLDENGVYSRGFVQSSELNPFIRLLVNRKTKPVMNWGSQIYRELIDSSMKNVPANLPYEDVKKALEDVEKILPAIKAGKKDANSALVKLANGYVKLARERNSEYGAEKHGK